MRALFFDPDSRGAEVHTAEIPEAHREWAQQWRRKLLEQLADLDDEVMLALLEEQDVPAEQIHRILRAATLGGQLQPTFCGASLDYIGVQPL